MELIIYIVFVIGFAVNLLLVVFNKEESSSRSARSIGIILLISAIAILFLSIVQ